MERLSKIWAFSFILLVLCVVMILLSTANGEAEYEKVTCIVKETQYVNVRNQARNDAQSLGKLHNGDEITPVSIVNGYFKFTFKEKDAYASIKYFEIPNSVNDIYTVEANGRIRIRNAPKGERVGWLTPGESVHIYAWRYDEDGEMWGRLFDGNFVSKEFLR